jgi:Tfp pilus assembly protein PilE
MKKLNSKGFTLVHALLLVVIAGMIAGVGYFVYNSQKKTNTALDNATKSQNDPQKSEKKEEAQEQDEDPTKDWKSYANQDPSVWLTASNPESCSEGLVLFAPTQDSLGICASEKGGQILISSSDGDNTGNYKLGEGYIDVSETTITINGVVSKKYSGTASKQSETQFIGGLPDGTKVIHYVAYANGKTYVVQYTQEPTYTDVQSDFELLVTKTLKFE